MDDVVTKSTPSEWKKGWLIVLSAFFITFVADGLLFSFGIMFVEIIDYFGKSRATTSGISTLFFATVNFVGPLASALAEKFGYRIVVIIGALVTCIGFVLSAFATNIYHLWIVYGFLGGFGLGLLYLLAFVCVLQHFNTNRTLAVGITISGSGIGNFVFNYCLRLLIDHYGWRGTMLMEAGFTLQCAVFGLLLVTSEKKSDVAKTEEPKPCVSSAKSFFFSVFNPRLLKDVKCMIYMFAVLFIQLALFLPFNYLPDQIEQEGMTKSEASMLMASIGIATIVSRVIFGWVGDRICFSRFILLIVVTLFNGVVTALSPLMSTFETKLIYTSLYGTLLGGCTTLLYGVLPEIVEPELISNAFGLLLFFAGIGATTGTPIAGYLFDQTGSYEITFIMCGSAFIIGAILIGVCQLPVFRTKNEDHITESTRF